MGDVNDTTGTKESLEHAQLRTQVFIKMILAELQALNVDPTAEPFIGMAEKIWPAFTIVEEHYEFREQLAGCYSSAAYKYLMRKWHSNLA